MPRELLLVAATLCLFAQTCSNPLASATEPESRVAPLEELLREYEDYTGSKIVFSRDELPEGRYHDVLKPLDESMRAKAVEVCLEQARKYPPRFFERVGLKCVGVFAACASKRTSGSSRPYDEQLGGYRYFGVYNGTDAVAAAFYTEGQLELTFHHEVFHHVDSTVGGITESWQLSADDAFYQAAIAGMRPYSGAFISSRDVEQLKQRRIGITLKDNVSEYAATNIREDQAETARHLMSTLADALVQVNERPDLPGSQRILHVLREYENAVPDGPTIDWFVDVALSRNKRQVSPATIDQLLAKMRAFAKKGANGYAGLEANPDDARELLREIIRMDPTRANAEEATEIVRLASSITGSLLRQRMRPDGTLKRFDVWGSEDTNGVNMTLRRDVTRFANDSRRLALIASNFHHASKDVSASVLQQQLANFHLVASYFVFIDSAWTVTSGTRNAFESARTKMLAAMELDGVIANQLAGQSLAEIAKRMPREITRQIGTGADRGN